MDAVEILMIEGLQYTFEQFFAIMGAITEVAHPGVAHPGEVSVIARVGNIEYLEGGVQQRKLVMMIEEFEEDDFNNVLCETVFALGQIGKLVPSGPG